MAKNHKEQFSWKEAFELNKKALLLLYKGRPQILGLRLFDMIWKALTPYVGIALSACIIEELSGRRDPQSLMRLVLASLIAASVITFISILLQRYQTVEGNRIYDRENELLMKKLMDMDFCVADEAEPRRLLSDIRQAQRSMGMGLNCALRNTEGFLKAVFTLLGGGALTLTLFTSKVAEGSRMAFLNSPLFLVVLIALMLGVTYLSPALATKAESYMVLNIGEINRSNRFFNHFGFVGNRNELAADVRIYRQDKLCGKYNKKEGEAYSSKGLWGKLARGPMGACTSASAALSGVFTCLVYVYVCLKACMGAFGIGMVTQYISSITRLSQGLSGLVKAAGSMRVEAAFIKQSFAFLEIPNVMYQGSLTIEKRSDRKYEVEFRDVSFQYPGSEQYALRHVNMKFNVGQRLAVVGQNGSGKTTFIKLLCRLYDPTEGVILLNGIDIRKYNYQEYLSIFSVVFQDFALTDFCLGQTVASKSEYDRELAADVLEKAGFGERLRELTAGLDTHLSKRFREDGVDMSSGEEQKIALARTLYKDAPFIVLDEPTAALDPIAEAEVYSKFNDIIEDKTAIYISHRLSSCKFCDEILVFDGGYVVQQGSHDALVDNVNGKYHELWYAQAQYYGENQGDIQGA